MGTDPYTGQPVWDKTAGRGERLQETVPGTCHLRRPRSCKESKVLDIPGTEERFGAGSGPCRSTGTFKPRVHEKVEAIVFVPCTVVVYLEKGSR